MSDKFAPLKAPARWLPFQCPSCFGLFRARRAEAGELGRCPGCATRLFIPEPEVSKPDTPEATEDMAKPERRDFAQAEIVEQTEVNASDAEWDKQTRKRRRFVGEKAESLDWEEEELSEKKTRISWVFVISMTMIGALLVAGGMKYLESSRNKDTTGGGLVAQVDSMLNQNAAMQKEMEADAEDEASRTRAMIESFDRFDPTKIREAIKGFLAAGTIEEKLKTCRASDDLEAKMRNYYAGDAPQVEGFRSLDQTKVVYRGEFISTFVRLQDFLDYPIVVERLDDDDYRVDWESWVGYCEKKIGEMIALKPTKPVLIRVVATNEAYYNYSFSDDQKWRSLKLEFRNEDRTLWGYAARDSDVGKAFKVYNNEVQSRPFILRVRYPENGRANDQVIIDEVISDGWVSFPKED